MDKGRIAELRNPHSGLTVAETKEVLDALEAALARAEGVEALRRFAERCAERDHQPDEHIGDAKCIACEAEGALRAAKGGEA